MRHFIRMDLPPEPIINDKCVRKRLKNSVCDSCSQVCPVGAISFETMNATIDNQLCYQLGTVCFHVLSMQSKISRRMNVLIITIIWLLATMSLWQVWKSY